MILDTQCINCSYTYELNFADYQLNSKDGSENFEMVSDQGEIMVAGHGLLCQ